MPPPSLEPDLATPADLAACRASLRQGSKSFFAASLLLPLAVRAPACSLYAFCRLADDAIDLGQDRLAALDQLRARLDLAYGGQPWACPVDRAMADVVRRFAIPQTLPLALLEGFAWDAENRRYQTIEELYAYAARVAATVGAMMALLMGARSAAALARACDLGVAMQLTNIARDVGEDARAGRLYLPLDWLAEAGIEPADLLARPRFSPALAGVIRRLLTAADDLYRRAGAGIAALPLACRPGIYTARYLYAGIGEEVARQGWDSVGRRAVLGGPRKFAKLARALATSPWPTAASAAPPLAETRFLVEAACASRGPSDPLAAAAAGPFAHRLIWLIGLFERLERRAQDLRQGGSI